MHAQRQRHAEHTVPARSSARIRGSHRAIWIAVGAVIALLVVAALIGVVSSASPRDVSAGMRQAIQLTYAQPAAAVVSPTPMPVAIATATARVIPTSPPPRPTLVPTQAAAARHLAQAQAAEAQLHAAALPSCPLPIGRIVTETINSDVAALPITVHVYLPPCYNPQEYAYPTLYLIHGTAYEQGGWIANGLPRIADLQMSLGLLPPFIIVMPGADMRAGDASTYSWSNWGAGSYEGFVTGELVPFIERKYSTWESREGRAIGGISRGGYWSIEIGFANPDTFSSVGGHSPSVGSMLVGMPANFSMLDTAKSIDALHALRIWLDAGDDDWARTDAQRLAEDLDAQGVAHTLDIGRGGHLDEYWSSRLPEYLAFYSAAWPRQARARQAMGLVRP
jgi:enterochelin esterase-like enzyme